MLDEFDKLIVLKAEPFSLEYDANGWKYDKANKILIAEFVVSLPDE